MKTKRTVVSLMLILAMVFSMNIAPKVASADEEGNQIICRVKVEAPYETYYANDSFIALDEGDLADSFGIGLPTDGSDAITVDGKTYKYTAIRAIAKVIREHIKRLKDIDDNTKESNDAADKLMPNFIKYKYTDGWIPALSNDGICFNTGAYKGTESTAMTGATAGTVVADSDNDGFWGFFVDKTYSANKGVEGRYVDENPGELCEINLSWIPYTGASYDMTGTGIGVIDSEYGDEEAGYELASEKTTYNVKKIDYDPSIFSFGSNVSSVSGASVSVYDSDTGKEVFTTTADDKGQFSLKKNFTPGAYRIVAREEATNAAGKTYSKITYTQYDMNLIKTPATPTKIKAKAKKNKVTVSWSCKENVTDYYEIYQSTKKNGKYRLATKKPVAGKKVTFKKGKGIKYIKIIHFERFYYGPANTAHVRDLYGKFSKPVKIK